MKAAFFEPGKRSEMEAARHHPSDKIMIHKITSEGRCARGWRNSRSPDAASEDNPPEEWPALSSGYRLEIERMQGEIFDYLTFGAALSA